MAGVGAGTAVLIDLDHLRGTSLNPNLKNTLSRRRIHNRWIPEYLSWWARCMFVEVVRFFNLYFLYYVFIYLCKLVFFCLYQWRNNSKCVNNEKKLKAIHDPNKVCIKHGSEMSYKSVVLIGSSMLAITLVTTTCCLQLIRGETRRLSIFIF